MTANTTWEGTGGRGCNGIGAWYMSHRTWRWIDNAIVVLW